MVTFQTSEAAFARVRDNADLREPLRCLAAAAGMDNYIALRLRGVSTLHLTQLVHSAPASHAERCEDVAYWRNSTLVQQLLKLSAPIVYEGNVTWAPPADIPGFEHGVAACVMEHRGACLLFLSRSGPPVTPAEQLDCILAATLGVARVADCLVRLQGNDCPLSERQLDCLRHAMAGHTATETARALKISARTVEQYLSRAREHLSAPTSLAAAVHAIDHGWMHPAEVIALMAA